MASANPSAKAGDVSGIAQFKKRTKAIARNVSDALAESIDDSAHDLLNRSDALSPQLSGAHIASGVVIVVSKLTRIIGYNKLYSARLHETEYNLGPISSKKPSTSDGNVGPRFLSRPFELHKREYIADAGRAVDDAIRRSIR